MKVLLIYPGVGRKPGRAYTRSWLMEPLFAAVLAALTPEDVSLRFVDDRLDDIPYGEDVDLVALSVETYSAKRAYAIADRFRGRGIPVVLGGFHPTLMPEEAGEHADAIVMGDGERAWRQILDDTRSGRLNRVYRGMDTDLDSIRYDRSVYDRSRYLRVRLVESGRGCRFGCEFCSVSRYYDKVYRPRPGREIAREVEGTDEIIFFVDDNIVVDPVRTSDLCRCLKPLGVKWIGQASIGLAANPALLREIRESGCRGLLVGFESLSASNLAQMGKAWNRTTMDYGEALRRFKDQGIHIYGTFIFGYDDDDRHTIERSVQFAIDNDLFMAAFNHLTPFPGTPLYARLRQEGRLLHDRWWLRDGCRFGEVVFRPGKMDPDELSEECYKARRRFYSTTSVARRWPVVHGGRVAWSDWISYAGINFMSAFAAVERQGILLGENLDDGGCP